MSFAVSTLVDTLLLVRQSPCMLQAHVSQSIKTVMCMASTFYCLMLQEQRHALRQLNILKNQKPDLDMSVLEGFTEDNLHTRIGKHRHTCSCHSWT